MKILKYFAVVILVVQIVLLVYSRIYFREPVAGEVHSNFLRISLLIGSAMMVILTRYFLRFVSMLNESKGIFLLQLLCFIPALLIPIGGFAFAYFTRSGDEYLLFFIIGLYHLVRYYSPITKMGGAL
ncbi:MAG TPA: hypothetical protein PKU94_04430 [Candidatus Hydrothermia bacterium]|nr:hypothetical protein [Candidatus Hydrothermae bacterium]MDD3648641.1 hypothetical protein [Candidatus Hydrothermia bacterium]MDD5572221.1 hypothetical protein [Candidatus Hydrothermia bacterium]HOK22499.1 hypothetical protein [Candidatus Hydrothermia bacterium]HOL23206.1 hypothetical protein [Candidatus Hydrothermia bacterium]